MGDYVGVGIGVLGIIAGTFFYLKSRRYIKACYYVDTNSLISPLGANVHGLEVLYDGRQIERLSVSNVFFWNQGTEAIRREDVAPISPLKIHVPAPDVILSQKILYYSSKHNNVAVMAKSNQEFMVFFDFLNPREGMIFEILHTGGVADVAMEQL
jgi:hypothetical protein